MSLDEIAGIFDSSKKLEHKTLQASSNNDHSTIALNNAMEDPVSGVREFSKRSNKRKRRFGGGPGKKQKTKVV